jgi:phosphotransferase system  glucose/maltose/N-acetylglucosamine-specific IIC component
MFDATANPIIVLIDSIMNPLLGIVGAAGVVYCVILGVQFAKAEEPQDREKTKGALKNAIIGFVIIFVLLLALKIMIPQMQNWVR